MIEEKGKSSFWKLKESFVGRILFIAFIFLVIPLFLVSAFDYFEDVRMEKNGAKLKLTLITQRIHNQLEESILQKITVLDMLDLFSLSAEKKGGVLENVRQKLRAEAVLHLKKDLQGKYLCDVASKDSLIGRDYSNVMQFKGEPFGYSEEEKQFTLFGDSDDADGVWVAFFPPDSLIDRWGLGVDPSYHTMISLLDAEGKIVATTHSDVKLHTFLEKKKWITAKRSLDLSRVSLLVIAPATVNLTHISHFLRKSIVFVIVLIVFGIVGTGVISYYLSRAFQELYRVMKRVGKGNLTLRFTPKPMGFEINVLGKIFNDVVTTLIERMQEVKREKIEKEVLARELIIGQEVQRSMIPETLPKLRNIDIGAQFISAQQVGGDFYDFLVKESREGEKLMIAIADTSGKGIYACLYSLSVRSMLRSYGKMELSLQEVMQKTNDLFCLDTADSGAFVTAWVGFLDKRTKELTFSNCGHYPALLKREDGSVISLSTSGMALGAMAGVEIETKQVQLKEGDLLLMMTDGVTEAHNEALEMFGEKRVVKALQEKREESAQEIVDALIEEVFLFSGGAQQHDDVTVIALKIGA